MKSQDSQQSLPWPIGSTQYQRIRDLASRMLSDFPSVRQTDDTSDVAHSAMIRLSSALQKVQPESELHFWRLVALAIRRTLADIARRSRRVLPMKNAIDVGAQQEARHQANWAEFHERAAELPELQREVLELHWYAGLSQQQVAELLDVDIRTVQRRWRAARLSLHRILFECVPTSAILNVQRNGHTLHDGET